MPRYTILIHDHPFLHWDFLLDPGQDELLRAWRILEEPGNERCGAMSLPPHRRMYLDFEGKLSGDRGSVSIWDQGFYELSMERGAEGGGARISIVCRGRKLWGEVELVCDSGGGCSYEYRPGERSGSGD